MRAAQFEECGDPESVLTVREQPVPQPGPGQVRVRMLASPINPSDIMYVRGVYGRTPQLPATPGFEGVGVVEESGGGLLGRLIVGKRVCTLTADGGAWAEYAVVDAKKAIPLPSSLTDEQGATFFVNPATALIMTRKVLAVPKGEWLLQTAAGSALGKMVIRLGAHYGFRTINVVRRTEKADELKNLGADVVLVFDPERDSAEEFAKQVRELTAGGVQYAIDPVGGATGSAVVESLGNQASMLVYGTLSFEPLTFSPRALMGHLAGIRGFWLGPWMEQQSLPAKLRIVSEIKRLIASGILGTDVAESVPLDSIQTAVATAQESGREGKVLLQLGNGAVTG
ncbi:Alcohol dehydrogenase [Maioricimonas rarisocia]|uniref:Alcohol dehydrogenase n=1 Tax=Maioricimonas rarisocia TaxID=2528026 RepID=A0A517Z1X4_9PLAN|nr:zinc-dependent alcohol dehydrogenase family protein [Maioricimonas rarisocia]QDU36470.1 Alcohol dehydrogenase [Maioricimonas rarisocia]